MKCHEAQDRLMARAAGELPSDRQPALEAHLSRCAICRAEAGRCAAAEAALAAVSAAPAPEGMLAALRARLDADADAPARSSRRWPWAPWGPAGALATAAAGIAVAIWLNPALPPPASDSRPQRSARSDASGAAGRLEQPEAPQSLADLSALGEEVAPPAETPIARDREAAPEAPASAPTAMTSLPGEDLGVAPRVREAEQRALAVPRLESVAPTGDRAAGASGGFGLGQRPPAAAAAPPAVAGPAAQSDKAIAERVQDAAAAQQGLRASLPITVGRAIAAGPERQEATADQRRRNAERARTTAPGVLAALQRPVSIVLDKASFNGAVQRIAIAGDVAIAVNGEPARATLTLQAREAPLWAVLEEAAKQGGYIIDEDGAALRLERTAVDIKLLSATVWGESLRRLRDAEFQAPLPAARLSSDGR